MALVIGLIKGALVGGAIGYGAYSLGLSGAWGWLIYGLVGTFVGLFVGRPLWSHLADKSSTVITPIIRGVFGFLVGLGLFALVAKVWGGFDLSMLGETRNVVDWPFVLGGAIGGLFGAFVEVDDKSSVAKEKKQISSGSD
jgi:hypothetical protein